MERIPYISVIVPTCQRNDLLGRCLDCLAPGKQTLSAAEYEVIVTDDGRSSTAEDLLKTGYHWARWAAGPGRGPAANRNNGARQAQGTWLAFVDDDCLPDSNWLQAIKVAAGEDNLEALEGKTVIPDRTHDPFRQGVENLSGGYFWSCNLAVRRETFWRIGAFDEDFLEAGGEDMEFAWRLADRRLPARFVPEALVLHPSRKITLKSMLWRIFLARWILLYNHKTGHATPLTESWVKAVVLVAVRHTIQTLRQEWQFLTRPHPDIGRPGWKSTLIYNFFGIVTFPFLIPYLMYWELRFRRLMFEKAK